MSRAQKFYIVTVTDAGVVDEVQLFRNKEDAEEFGSVFDNNEERYVVDIREVEAN